MARDQAVITAGDPYAALAVIGDTAVAGVTKGGKAVM